jgi:iron(III) transport system permease protein
MSVSLSTSRKAPLGASPFLHRFDRWSLATALIAAITLIPVTVVLASLAHPDAEIWLHLSEHVLPDLLTNTFWLVLGVGAGVLLLGVSLAWLTGACAFPGSRAFSWALLLPLAMPAYVTAFVAIGLLDFTGPLQTWWREVFGMTRFLPIRSRGGVIAVLTLALYPYVYLIARNAFMLQGKQLLEAAQSLGLSRTAGFFRVALPMARPAIAGGLMLALMETLADFGTVAVFNYDTFTTGIYKAWFSLFSLPAAGQLASILILFVFAAAFLEYQSRARGHYATTSRGLAAQETIRLSGWRAWLASGYCLLVLSLAFLIPLAQLGTWAWRAMRTDLDARYWEFVAHSLLLAGLSAAALVGLALVLGYALRQRPGPTMRGLTRLATLGYAVPGSVLAVGIFIPVAWLDNRMIDLAEAAFGYEGGQILQGTLVVMLLAYAARFLAAAHSPVDAGLTRITRSVDEASRALGTAGIRLIGRVHLPMLRASLLTGAALVFVDVMKEMPITLMTRPFGWDTLAVRVFEMTSEGEWERAALPSVAIVIAGLLPVYLLVKGTERH